jgi:hypothetical protein
MRKNSHLHIVVETETLLKLKNEANEENISLSELCRQKLGDPSQMDIIKKIVLELKNEK